jgi:hypothetical protein
MHFFYYVVLPGEIHHCLLFGYCPTEIREVLLVQYLYDVKIYHFHFITSSLFLNPSTIWPHSSISWSCSSIGWSYFSIHRLRIEISSIASVSLSCGESFVVLILMFLRYWWHVVDAQLGTPRLRCDEHSSKFSLSYETKV